MHSASIYALSSPSYVPHYLQGDKISTILKAAKVEVEPYWPGLFAKALAGQNIGALLTNVSGPAVAGGAASPAAATPAAEDKEPEKKGGLWLRVFQGHGGMEIGLLHKVTLIFYTNKYTHVRIYTRTSG